MISVTGFLELADHLVFSAEHNILETGSVSILSWNSVEAMCSVRHIIKS